MEGCSGVEAAAVAVAESGGEGVEARELTGRIDPEMGIILGVGRKIPPEKFSGGGWPERWAAGEKGKEFGFDLKEDEVVPRVKDVSLVDGVFDNALGSDGDEDFAIGDVEAIEEEEEGEEEYDEENEEYDHYLIKRL
ncbi:hypothetical protein Tco_0413029 [Tanacetum coccineum]